jgi:hypothetical protein
LARKVVTVVDRGYLALRARIVGANGRLKVGCIGDRALEKYEDSDITTAEVAEIHEFGRGNSPERSWLRGYVAENVTRLEAMIRRCARAIYDGKITEEQALALFGQQVVGEIKKRIVAGIAPALAESTLAAKGSGKTTPLVNTGQFIGSISHAIVPKGGT